MKPKSCGDRSEADSRGQTWLRSFNVRLKEKVPKKIWFWLQEDEPNVSVDPIETRTKALPLLFRLFLIFFKYLKRNTKMHKPKTPVSPHHAPSLTRYQGAFCFYSWMLDQTWIWSIKAVGSIKTKLIFAFFFSSLAGIQEQNRKKKKKEHRYVGCLLRTDREIKS